MKNVKFRGKKMNSAENSAAQIPRQKPKFRKIPRAVENCGPYMLGYSYTDTKFRPKGFPLRLST